MGIAGATSQRVRDCEPEDGIRERLILQVQRYRFAQHGPRLLQVLVMASNSLEATLGT